MRRMEVFVQTFVGVLSVRGCEHFYERNPHLMLSVAGVCSIRGLFPLL